MFYVDTKMQENKIRGFIIDLRKKQVEIETDDTFIYPAISITTALKYDILISELLFHPLVLRTRKFYEPCDVVTKKKDVINKISEVLTKELSDDADKTLIDDVALDEIIRAYKRLTKKRKNATDTTGI